MQIAKFDCQDVITDKFSKTYSNLFFSETVRWMKLILSKHVYDIALLIVYVFCSGRIRTLVAMATFIFHKLIMSKVGLKMLSVKKGIFGKYFTKKLLSRALCFR